MRRSARLLGACGMLIALCLLTVVQADEEKVPLDKLPQNVLDAVKARFPKANLIGAEKETEDGKTVFEVAIKDKDQSIDVSLIDGKIVEIEKQIAAADLPKAAAAAVDAKYPKAKLKVIEEVVKVKDGNEKLEYYEVHLVNAEGNSIEIQIAASGKILATEKDSDDDDKKDKKK